MKIAKGQRIRIKIRLAVVDGDEIEKNVVEYFQGAGTMLPGLEQELEGLEKGAAKKGVIKAENAFGNPTYQVEKPMKRSEFGDDAKLEAGTQFMAKGADSNQDVVLRIKEIDGDDVTVLLLHPLADKDIEYDVEVLSVTDPNPPPLPPEAVGASSESDSD
ncbi:MAG: FKBP-type peptidyl-prolyl cis-trans isomerase [Myxococcota bacterium]